MRRPLAAGAGHGKEQLLQFAQYRRSGGSSIILRGLFLTSFILAAGGCETTSFFDPSEMGRYTKTPHMVRILNNLDTGLEEPDDRFTNAQDVRPSDLVSANMDYVIGPNDLIQVSIADL